MKSQDELLKDFSQSPDKQKSGIFSGFYKHSVPLTRSFDKWRLVRFLFDEVLNFKIYDQPSEKINWEIPFTYKGKYECSVAHQKFGFRVYISNEDTVEAEVVASEIERALDKALDIAEPIVREYARQALDDGEISVDNRLRELQRPYAYFRDQVMSRDARLKELSDTGAQLDNAGEFLNLREEISFYEQAAYVSYFSLLEHICVLALAFRDVPDRRNIKLFAQHNWQEKFKIVFDISRKKFKESYDYLVGLSKYKRNPSVHGLFDKLHTIFHFYLKPANHRVSVGLYDQEVRLPWYNEELNFAKLDDFMKLLETHSSTTRIMAYLNAGLNVSFTDEHIDLEIFPTEADYQMFLEYQIRKYDDMANMDW